MSTLSDLLCQKTSPGPYHKGVKVKTVAVCEEVLYKSKDGTEKKCLTVAVSDGVEVVKCIIYDASKFSRFKVGTTVILRNIIKKTEEGPCIVVTSATKVYISSEIEVPDAHKVQGEKIITPLPAEFKKINEALNSPPRKKMSVKGKIVQEEESRVVNVKGTQVPIKCITISDDTGSSRVTLWREVSETDVRPGDHVHVTDVVVNHYNNAVSLQTTTRSMIEKIDAPEEVKVVTVEAVAIDGGIADLLTADGDSLSVPAELLQQVFGDIEAAINEGSFSAKIIMKGSEVTAIEKLHA